MPKISVLMPVYNPEEDYLREAIESIQNQTYSDFEFIIINDGSTNNTKQVILSYDDSRIKYFENEENLGLIKTLNRGLGLAAGQYIARMDADDISLPERFAKQVDYLDKNEDIDVLGTWFKKIPKNKIVKMPTTDKDIKNLLLFVCCSMGHPTVMIRKSTLDKYDFKYNEEYKHAEDYGLWLSMADKAKFANLPEVLLNYRWHNTNISVTKSEEQSKITNKLRHEYQKKFLGKECNKEIDIYSKIQNKEKINSKEFEVMTNFIIKLVKKLEEPNIAEEYKGFYKNTIKMCKKDFHFLHILWNNELNKFIKIGLYFKLKNSLIGG